MPGKHNTFGPRLRDKRIKKGFPSAQVYGIGWRQRTKIKAATMSSEVPYSKKAIIEAEAARVLSEYGQQFRSITAPPITIDEVVELHLKLILEIRDLQQIFGFCDVHGAIWVPLAAHGC